MAHDGQIDDTVRLYGIPNCDSVKSARRWLEENGIAFEFHDFRKEGVHAGHMAKWCTALGWEKLLNRRSTTWKQLPESEREVDDAAHAMALMLKHPTLIKRPVMVVRDLPVVGFSSEQYAELLKR